MQFRKEEILTTKSDIYAIESVAVKVDEQKPENSFVDSKTKMSIGKDGHLFFTESHHMIYLYKEQVEHLKDVLAEYDKHFS